MNDSILSVTHPSASRIGHLDILRGFALLGILLMNMQSFAMPGSAYFNPTSWGNFEGINFAVWAFCNLFADSKFMAIFSLLFGAGICLFSERAEQKSGSSAALHYQRNFWLLLFGLCHAYFIWFGDILFSYAVCAFILYFFRNFSVRTLCILAVVFLIIASAYNAFVQWVISEGLMPDEAIRQIMRFWAPNEAYMQKEIAAYTGNVIDQFNHRQKAAYFLQTDVLFSFTIWRAGGMMLLGMALYKSGVLSGKKSTAFYRNMMLTGCILGLALTGLGIVNNLEHKFVMEYSMFTGTQFNYWGSMFMALGYVGMIQLVIQSGMLKGLQQRLAAVGQMAFTNYIAQSVFVTFIFYGHGFGLYGEIERVGQFALVLAVWALQLWYSPIWLAKFRFGPLEWAWRSLTYRSLQTMAR